MRFRGLVFDVFDLEFFCESYQLKGGESSISFYCKYRDTLRQHNDDFEVDEESIKTGSRTVYLFVSIPGETDWVNKQFGSSLKITDPDICSVLGKRPLELLSEGSLEGVNIHHHCCIVKVYNQSDGIGFRLNDMVELVGIVTYPSHNEDMQMDMDILDEVEDVNKQLPRRPVIHCLAHRKLSSSFPSLVETNEPSSSLSLTSRWGLIQDSSSKSLHWSLNDNHLQEIETHLLQTCPRNRLLDLFQSHLGGDRLAAEFLLLYKNSYKIK